jgi:hypothetical protein
MNPGYVAVAANRPFHATGRSGSKQRTCAHDAPAFSAEPLESGTIGSSAPQGALTAARIDMHAGLDLVAVSVYAQINRGLAYPNAQAIIENVEMAGFDPDQSREEPGP